MWDLVKTRHGKKHFVKAIKVSKDYGWRTALASLTVKVGLCTPFLGEPNNNNNNNDNDMNNNNDNNHNN